MPEPNASTDFIQAWEGALDAPTCAALIERFERSGQATRGKVGSGVDTELKDSWDICIDHASGWADVVDRLNATMASCLVDYVRRHPFVVLAPLTLRVKQPGGDAMVMLTPEAIAAMEPERLMKLVTTVFRPGTINLQKYFADQGGYPYWHCEYYPKAGDPEPLHRVLLWTLYLNEGFGEGETEFFHQARKFTPRTGSLLIAPAGFTHTHRGNRPRGGNKYIATSWILYQHAERLFGAPAPTPTPR